MAVAPHWVPPGGRPHNQHTSESQTQAFEVICDTLGVSSLSLSDNTRRSISSALLSWWLTPHSPQGLSGDISGRGFVVINPSSCCSVRAATGSAGKLVFPPQLSSRLNCHQTLILGNVPHQQQKSPPLGLRHSTHLKRRNGGNTEAMRREPEAKDESPKRRGWDRV